MKLLFIFVLNWRINVFIIISNSLRKYNELANNNNNFLPSCQFSSNDEGNTLSRSPSPLFLPRYRPCLSPPLVSVTYIQRNKLLLDEDEISTIGKRNVSPSSDSPS
jgi:hypothetical protein